MFERFTDRARRVLVLAQEEARLLNHGFIGTEHILLGLMGEADGVAAKALESLGVGLDDMRAQVEIAIEPGTGGPVSTPPFTPRSKKVLELSLREALKLGHNYIGTEHMLLGLVREGEGVAAEILLAKVGDLGRVRDAVVELLQGYAAGGLDRDVAVDLASPSPGLEAWRRLRTSPGLLQSLRTSNLLAVQRGGQRTSLDMLLALATEGRSRAARILETAGLTPDRIEELARQIGVEGTSDELPDEALARHVTVSYDSDGVTVRIDDPEIAAKVMEATGSPKGGAIMGTPDLAEVVHTVVRIAESLGRALADDEAGPTETPVTADEAAGLLRAMSEARIRAVAEDMAKPVLTAHEGDVLEGLAAGVSIDDVAANMGISVEQAESIATNVRNKVAAVGGDNDDPPPAE